MVVVGGPLITEWPVTGPLPCLTPGRNNITMARVNSDQGGYQGEICLHCGNEEPDAGLVSANCYLTMFPVDHLAAVNVFLRFK